MKLKQIYLFGTLFLVVACGGGGEGDRRVNSCEEGWPSPREFDVTDVYVQVLLASEPKGYPSEIFGESYNDEFDVKFDGIVFSLNSDTQMITMKGNKPKGFSFSLVSSAYACSPSPARTKEKIVDIEISSSSAFDGSLPAGEDLKSKFDVVYADSLTDYYAYENNSVVYYSLERYLEQEEVYAGNVIQLKLNEEPEFPGNHFFFIEVILDTGEVFMLETPEIHFSKL